MRRCGGNLTFGLAFGSFLSLAAAISATTSGTSAIETLAVVIVRRPPPVALPWLVSSSRGGLWCGVTQMRGRWCTGAVAAAVVYPPVFLFLLFSSSSRSFRPGSLACRAGPAMVRRKPLQASESIPNEGVPCSFHNLFSWAFSVCGSSRWRVAWWWGAVFVCRTDVMV